ncbi:hypothetical protein HJG60_011650 [Phyllostomus discolor]|uniref:Uncharacterized protein n=1 Tax=Phyllostomus discolor TaxID=89673 RepID=A0A834E107_9CHIR|nr:hypothetical protein HJG60_011650 [Phyllostomus discolor]
MSGKGARAGTEGAPSRVEGVPVWSRWPCWGRGGGKRPGSPELQHGRLSPHPAPHSLQPRPPGRGCQARHAAPARNPAVAPSDPHPSPPHRRPPSCCFVPQINRRSLPFLLCRGCLGTPIPAGSSRGVLGIPLLSCSSLRPTWGQRGEGTPKSTARGL